MLVAGVLGFQSLVLVVCLVVPLIGFVVRRKWRLALARKEEIRRLLILASEEAARAELEASAQYGVVAAVAQNQCAVCYFPTTTRCARCKAVRYCSGKCQIMHWRQGHKEECRPACPTQTVNDIGKDSSQKLNKEEHSEVYSENYESIERAKPVQAFPSKSAHTNNGCSAEVLYEKEEGSEVESIASGKGVSSTFESGSTSFSGFSTSTTNSDLADDVSVTESISSADTESSDGHLSVDSSSDELHTTLHVRNEDNSQPLSPKFARLVDAVNGITVSKLNETESSCNGGEDRCRLTCSSHPSNSSVHDGPAQPLAASSGFWEKALDSISPPDDTHHDDTSDSSGLGSSKVSGGTSLHFSFKLSRRTAPPLFTKGSSENVALSKDALTDELRVKKHTSGSSLSKSIDSNAPKTRACRSLNREASKNLDNGCESFSNDFNSREAKSMLKEGASKCADSSNVGIAPSTRAQKLDLDHVVSNNKTSNPMKSEDDGYLLSSTHLASGTKDSSIKRSKAGDDAGQDSATVSGQVSNYPNVRNGLKTSVQKVVEQFRGSNSKLTKQYPLAHGSEIAGRYTDKGLFPYDSFVKLYNWNKVELQPSGLINCGNSCYANAVLQCLAFTPPLTAYFLQGIHSKDCIKKEWCFTCEFEGLILKAKEKKSPLSPIGIVSRLQNIGSQLGNGREEDAHEFLSLINECTDRYAIDAMQSICLAEARVGASGHLEEETTLLGLTFGGYLRSKIKCMKCQGRSERQEGMLDLTVEIEGDIGSLEEALRKFTSTEILDGENKYHCGRCKSYEKAKKKLTILEAPNVLTIALKRFQSGKFGKLNKPIRFPEILNLAPFMSGTSDKLAIYRLYGVVVHLDVMNAAFSGHYVCYVKNAHNKWFKIDDSTVTPVDLEKVLSKGAYMLFYARCSPRAPRLIRNRIVSSDPKARVTPSWIGGGKTTALKSKSTTNPNVAQFLSSSSPPGVSASYDSFYARYHRLQRILEEDSSSDNSSLISNNSDEGSCSTDSTRDSTSTDDLSDYIFGDSGRVWSSPVEELL
ncbi:Ubiquitin carboxyl-terminal hydrolase 16 [Morus notabilis]|uniref:ubiquitinyl hydrolase 1 n=1 Tax=Morus notabilis TaxID=981085 RepID=W9RXF9_9ROSA|nr:Ubiquitin carboxyl-terminal hydrolase 16 [Morus notabilis]